MLTNITISEIFVHLVFLMHMVEYEFVYYDNSWWSEIWCTLQFDVSCNLMHLFYASWYVLCLLCFLQYLTIFNMICYWCISRCNAAIFCGCKLKAISGNGRRLHLVNKFWCNCYFLGFTLTSHDSIFIDSQKVFSLQSK